MPVKTVIDIEKNLVTHTINGGFGLVDIEPAWRAMLVDPKFQAGMNVLWDFRLGMQTSSFSADDMRHIVSMTAEHIKQRGAEYKLALLAPRDLYFGLSRMFEAYGDEIPIKIHAFRSMQEALDWLKE
ncbi:MAG TPA: hypothetical protein ENI98_14740 [Gammaproteobacteria bacterium]|nr:hypothetical protein [Gammaproteobacteria bacterium]